MKYLALWSTGQRFFFFFFFFEEIVKPSGPSFYILIYTSFVPKVSEEISYFSVPDSVPLKITKTENPDSSG